MRLSGQSRPAEVLSGRLRRAKIRAKVTAHA
jgi:hypothetical protein